MSNITAIPALSDNYIWALAPATPDTEARVAIVDPGDARPVRDWLQQHQLRVGAIVITHHHADHTAGVSDLLAHEQANSHNNIPVYGPCHEDSRIDALTHPLADGDSITLDWLGLTFSVLAVPGHTLDHIALHAPGVLLAGDTLFRGGCGRVFEGSAAQMQQSLARLRNLDGSTRVYAGHEYTQKNLAFARRVEPDNADIAEAATRVAQTREAGQPTLPAQLAEERRINPFLRWDVPAVVAAASQHAGRELNHAADIFAELRAWKNAT